MRARRHAARFAFRLALLLLAGPAAAQDAAASEPAAPAEVAPAKPKPRPRPKSEPKSELKPARPGDAARAAPKAGARAAPAPATGSGPPDLSTLDLGRPGADEPASSRARTEAPGPDGRAGAASPSLPDGRDGKAPAPSKSDAGKPDTSKSDARKEGAAVPAIETPFAPPVPETPATPAVPPRETPPAAPGAVVACEPGQSILYDEPNGFAFWVTRIGTVTINNPLRPLTPDVTRVLQLVIAGKLATAYGPDLTVLRRGGTPGALEGLLGGPIRWEPALGTLPDPLDIAADSGAPLASMRFRECGTAPVGKAPAPVAGKERKPGRKAGAGAPSTPALDEPPPASMGAAGATSPVGRPAQAGAAPPRRFNLPQGAIPE